YCFFSSRRRHTRSTRDWSSDVCSSDLHDVFAFGELLLDAAVQPLVLEVEHRVVVADGRLDEALRIPRGGGIDDLQAWRVEEGRLRILRMERPATHIPAAGAAHDDRRREAGAIAG